ncbi:hypothetical protein G7Y89_g12973 [Cudoniella acicularis]|uniref:Uncharacterized protein n=1 Tax=Cudoniella acicularis TaxID=354080 RepID=A0A8H4RBK9_9HELO|nr:hypothetical protein G7Y89_g12973 [Cudoniella acicularis]
MLRPKTSTQLVQLRFNSTTEGRKQSSKHIDFYRTFTRPIVKVLLLATFTYQLAYWGWVRLEKDEIKAERNGEIRELERELEVLIEEKGLMERNIESSVGKAESGRRPKRIRPGRQRLGREKLLNRGGLEVIPFDERLHMP